VGAEPGVESQSVFYEMIKSLFKIARSALKDCEGLGLRKRDGLDRMSTRGMFGWIPAGVSLGATRWRFEWALCFGSTMFYDTGQQYFCTWVFR